MRAALLVPLVLATVGCAADVPRQRLTIATIASSNLFGGEALYRGKLVERAGCIVAAADGSFATPIFDPGVTLADDGEALVDAHEGVQVPIGRLFEAGTAWLRDDGEGWSLAEIDSFYGTRIPPGCPTDNVIRLHDFEVTEQGIMIDRLAGSKSR
jgi:hypothetical protein